MKWFSQILELYQRDLYSHIYIFNIEQQKLNAFIYKILLLIVLRIRYFEKQLQILWSLCFTQYDKANIWTYCVSNFLCLRESSEKVFKRNNQVKTEMQLTATSRRRYPACTSASCCISSGCRIKAIFTLIPNFISCSVFDSFRCVVTIWNIRRITCYF